ncbi:TPA: hypothetical protein ACH3X1_006547 [Trebouxia sp. C0004]
MPTIAALQTSLKQHSLPETCLSLSSKCKTYDQKAGLHGQLLAVTLRFRSVDAVYINYLQLSAKTGAARSCWEQDPSSFKGSRYQQSSWVNVHQPFGWLQVEKTCCQLMRHFGAVGPS